MTVQYIAIGLIGAGSVYGQSDTYEQAVKIATSEAISFAKVFGGFRKDADPIGFSVYDYRPWESIMWDGPQVWGYKTKDRSDKPTALTAERFVWVDPHTRKTVRDLTYEQWRLERAASALA